MQTNIEKPLTADELYKVGRKIAGQWKCPASLVDDAVQDFVVVAYIHGERRFHTRREQMNAGERALRRFMYRQRIPRLKENGGEHGQAVSIDRLEAEVNDAHNNDAGDNHRRLAQKCAEYNTDFFTAEEEKEKLAAAEKKYYWLKTQLTMRQWQVFNLRVLWGYPVKTILTRMQITQANYKQIRKDLQKKLKILGFEHPPNQNSFAGKKEGAEK